MHLNVLVVFVAGGHYYTIFDLITLTVEMLCWDILRWQKSDNGVKMSTLFSQFLTTMGLY